MNIGSCPAPEGRGAVCRSVFAQPLCGHVRFHAPAESADIRSYITQEQADVCQTPYRRHRGHNPRFPIW